MLCVTRLPGGFAAPPVDVHPSTRCLHSVSNLCYKPIHSPKKRMAKYRIKSIGSSFVPQKRLLWWWKDMAPPQPTEHAAASVIHHRKDTRPAATPAARNRAA